MADFLVGLADDGLPTHSSTEQLKTEEACRDTFEEWASLDGSLARDACAATLCRAHRLPPMMHFLTTPFCVAQRRLAPG